MANEFKVKKGLIVDGSGGTILDVQGSAGQLFSVTDSLTGDLFAVSDISGIPILNVNSSGAVDIDGTLAITDDVTLTSFGAGYLKTNVNGVISNTATIPWSTVSSTPTTISGYGITDALTIGTTATTAMAGDTAIPSASDILTLLSTNNIVDWTADQGSTNIHSGNYTDTDTWIANSATAAGYVASGANQANKVWKTDANGNPSWDDDRDTVYTHPTSAGNKHIPTGGSAGQFLKYSASGTATWATPSYTTNTNTTYSAGGGLDLTGTTFSIEADLRDGITKVGKDGSNYIAIDADDNNCIDFYISGDWVARMEADGDLHMKGDVIAFSGIFNP
jgi:hypothetical protein